MYAMWPLIQIHMQAVTAETATDHGSYTRTYMDYKRRVHAT